MLWAKRSHDQHKSHLSRINDLEVTFEGLRQAVVDLQSLQQSPPNANTRITTGREATQRQANEEQIATSNLAAVRAKKQDNKDSLELQITQGTHSLQDYLDMGETLKIEREAELVKGFLKGITSKHQRVALEASLDKSGWTWEILKDETQKMIADSERRARDKRTLLA